MKTALSLIITVLLTAMLPGHGFAAEASGISQASANCAQMDTCHGAPEAKLELALSQPLRGGDYGV